MALATKPKKTLATKKSRAQHHRQSKHYLKPYWPYLPMLAIAGLGTLANLSLEHSPLLGAHEAYAPEAGNTIAGIQAAQPISRLAVLTGGQIAWLTTVVSLLTGIALVYFVLVHSYRVHRVLNRGEAFIAKHPYLDIAIMLVITGGYILTRDSSLIR